MPPKQETTVPKNKAKAKSTVPDTEKYDWSRSTGADPRDPMQDDRSTMFRAAQPGSEGTWFKEWGQPLCMLGELRSLWLASKLITPQHLAAMVSLDNRGRCQWTPQPNWWSILQRRGACS